MKTLTKNNLSLYMFEDDKTLRINPTSLVVGDPVEFIISDCGTDNSVVYENITTPPEDWIGCKYLYNSGVWTLSPDWFDPSNVNVESV